MRPWVVEAVKQTSGSLYGDEASLTHIVSAVYDGLWTHPRVVTVDSTSPTEVLEWVGMDRVYISLPDLRACGVWRRADHEEIMEDRRCLEEELRNLRTTLGLVTQEYGTTTTTTSREQPTEGGGGGGECDSTTVTVAAGPPRAARPLRRARAILIGTLISRGLTDLIARLLARNGNTDPPCAGATASAGTGAMDPGACFEVLVCGQVFDEGFHNDQDVDTTDENLRAGVPSMVPPLQTTCSTLTMAHRLGSGARVISLRRHWCAHAAGPTTWFGLPVSQKDDN